jgi:hypothetical protein
MELPTRRRMRVNVLISPVICRTIAPLANEWRENADAVDIIPRALMPCGW